MMPRVDTVEMLARVLSVTAGWLGFVFGTRPSVTLDTPELPVVR